MASLSPGQSFGRYEIAALLGEGGMGEVYRARDTKLRRNVALKVIHPDAREGGLTHGVVTRFTREAQAAAALAHPNVVTVFDVGDVDGIPFIAMELLDGVTLRSMIDGRASIAQRLEWLLEMARALAAAHDHGLVHRDVKPDNVMICGGHVKVLDFGIAKWIDEVIPELSPRSDAIPSVRTATGHAVGTPRYMAPEQTRGRAVDASADQFAWGIVAYEVLAREHPQERTAHFTKEGDWAAPPAPLSELVPELPFGVSAIVMKTLEKWPKERFEGMEDVIAVLAPIVSSEDATAIADGDLGGPTSRAVDASVPTPKPAVSRPLGLIPMIGLAIVAVIAVAIVTAPTKGQPVQTIAPPPTSGAVAIDDPNLVQLEFRVLEGAANANEEAATTRSLMQARLSAICFGTEIGKEFLRSVNYSVHRFVLQHDPSGWITSTTISGFLVRWEPLKHCIEGALVRINLPSGLAGTEVVVLMKITPLNVPPALPVDAGTDAQAITFGLGTFPTESTHYDKAMVDSAFAPVSAEIVRCKDKEVWVGEESGLIFNVILRFDAEGKIEKRTLEAYDRNLLFNDCVKNALKPIVLPSPKDKMGGTLKIGLAIAPMFNK